MDKSLEASLIRGIKLKKQISGISDDFVRFKLNTFFLTNGDVRKKIELEYGRVKNVERTKIFKSIVKLIEWKYNHQIKGERKVKELVERRAIFDE